MITSRPTASPAIAVRLMVITPSKNVHHLIEAFQTIGTRKKLVIVGEGSNTDSYIAELRRLAAGDERILFTGALANDLLAEIFTAYLFAFPTAHEGMSMALLEALAYGVPTLVSDIPENLEIIGENHNRCGLTFRMGSVADLARQMDEALARPETLNALRVRGPALVARRYTWEQAAARTEELYYEIIGDNR
jgi:glycosyltransferase involved in cell wall biosynthesis